MFKIKNIISGCAVLHNGLNNGIITFLLSLLCGQGFQFIVDDSGGFSAVAADFLENIADEYTNTPVLLYAVRGPGSHVNPQSRKQTVSRDLHDAVSFSKLSSFCKVIIPIGLPFLSTSKQFCLEFIISSDSLAFLVFELLFTVIGAKDFGLFGSISLSYFSNLIIWNY